MEIKSDIRNELFKRNEIEAELEAEKNPSFEETSKTISETLGKPEESIEVYNIKGSFGSNKFVVKAYSYDSKEDKEKAIQLTQKQRKANTEESVKVETSSEQSVAEETPVSEAEKPAEAPAEASVEEALVEEKPEEEVKAVKEEQIKEEEAKE